MFTVALFLITGLLMTGCKNDDDDVKKNPPGVDTSKDLTFTATAQNGTLHKANTTLIALVFSDSVPRDGLGLADFTITDGTGSITAVSINNTTGPNRALTIVVEKEGTINLKINRSGFSSDVVTVEVFKKLGFEEDLSVSIIDVVKIGGTPVKGGEITFARYDGDPIAVIPPVTYDPVTLVSPAAPALSETLATFDPPLDLRNGPGGQLRWFDMVWEGFGHSWEFENESGNASYTGRNYNLHNVQFYLDLITTNDERIRFNRLSETNTTSGAKNPVQFSISNVLYNAANPAGNSPWDEGHQIKEIRLTVHSVQLRSPTNNAWPSLSSDRNCNFDDLWLVSLSAEIATPPPTIVLYENETWHSMIQNPKWGHGDAAFGVNANDATIIPSIPASDGTPNRIVWDPIDVTVTDSAPYSTLVVTFTGASGWYGYGSISLRNDEPVVNMNWSGGGNPAQIALDSAALYENNYFNKEQFIGFFIQGNEAMTSLLVTRIVLE